MKERRNGHPTQKPLEVMIWSLRQLPNDARVILDPYMGSGTTGVACTRTGRRFVGIEIDPQYFEMAKHRIQKQIALVKAKPELLDQAGAADMQFLRLGK